MNDSEPPSEMTRKGFLARLFPRYRKSAQDEATVIDDAKLLAPLFPDQNSDIAADLLWRDAIEAGGEAVPQLGPAFASPAFASPAFRGDVQAFAEPARVVLPEREAEPQPAVAVASVRIRLLQDMVFGRDGNDAACIGEGWSRPEPVHRWTINYESEMELNRPGHGDALLVFDATAFTRLPALPSQRLLVQVNDAPVGSLVVKDNRRLALRVPAAALADHGAMRLRFSHPDAASPADFGAVPDKRRLGICFRRLRVFAIAGPAPACVEGAGGLGLAGVEARTGVPPEQMIARFESLGDNAEFGLVQRQAGAEPLGLLRFAMLGLAQLVLAIESGFDGTGDAANLKHAVLHDKTGRPIHEMRDQASGLCYRAEQVDDGMDDETLIIQQARRLKILRRQLLEEMRSGEKIFVFRRHPSRGELGEAEILPLLQALHQHGPCTLLFTVLADQDNPPGTVTRIIPGLLCGYLDSIAPYEAAQQISLDVWLEICANALALTES